MIIKNSIRFLLFANLSLRAGSILSSGGIGMPMDLSNGRSMGMGGVSLAVPDPFDLPRTNPAALHSLDYSRFAIQYLYENTLTKAMEGSARSPFSNFDGFVFGIPITSRAAFTFSLLPTSRMDFRTSLPGSINETYFEQVYSGSGGLNTINLSAGYRVFNNLSAGLTGHYYFGRIEKNWVVNFPESQYYTTKTTHAVQASGVALTYGIQYQIRQSLMIGATYRPGLSLDSKTYLDYKSMDDGLKVTYIHQRDTLAGSLDLPESFGLGLGWRPAPKWLFGFDWIYNGWDAVSKEFYGETELKRVSRYAVGVEYQPSQNPYAPFLKESHYRAGFSFEPYYIQSAPGTTINTWWITVGMGVPVWNKTSRANIAFAYGQRGSVKDNGLSENLFRIILSLDAGEKWFVRRH